MKASELKAWRASLDLTQAEAAKELGVSRRTYEKWEIGREPSNPSILRLACYAIASGMSLDEAIEEMKLL